MRLTSHEHFDTEVPNSSAAVRLQRNIKTETKTGIKAGAYQGIKKIAPEKSSYSRRFIRLSIVENVVNNALSNLASGSIVLEKDVFFGHQDYQHFESWNILPGLSSTSDAAKLTLEDSSTDTILSFETLEHLQDSRKALAECYGCAEKILSCPFAPAYSPMSKLLIACTRGENTALFSTENIERLSQRLEPNNILFHPPKIISDSGRVISIFNPNTSLQVHGSSLCLGQVLESEGDWWKPMSRIPNGSYALFRCDDRYIEVVTDIVASRTVWYFYSDDLYIVSTSQRAIIYFLNSFSLNQDVISWMLSTGTLGPGNAWDSRVKFVEANSSLALDRQSWTLEFRKNELYFGATEQPEEKHEEDLKKALDESFEHLKLDYSKWVLPLSGGYDSRCILLMLREKTGLRSVTWGLEKSQDEEGNDASIAKQLADFFNLKHQYFFTDLSEETAEAILHRFLVCGEGRIDHISGYLDGFRLWKTLFEQGVEGIIRGDQPFSGLTVKSPLDVRRRAGLSLLSDFNNLNSLSKLGLTSQMLPEALEQGKTESLSAWRDRLYLQFRGPFVWAALTDLKLPYVEVINPLLTHEVVAAVCNLPESLRSNKKLFKRIVDRISPDIAYASRPAIDYSENILRNKEITNVILNGLQEAKTAAILPEELINFVLEKIQQDEAGARKSLTFGKLFRKLKRVASLPKRLSKRLSRRLIKHESDRQILDMDYHLLAFRIYIIYSMSKILSDDAEGLSKP